MADPVTLGVAGIGMATSVLGGIAGAKGAQVSAQGQQLGIQGQILDTVSKMFGLQTQAQQYGYSASIADYQAGVAKVNKQIAAGNADYARATGEVTAEAAGMKGKADLASMAVHQSASGIDINSGSSARVRTGMTEMTQYGEDMIRVNAAKQAYGFEVEAMQDDAQSKLYTYTGDVNRAQAANTTAAMGLAAQAIPLEQTAYGLAGQAGDIGSTASLLGAAGTVSSQWMKASSLGIFKPA
jgi:hypothetical protein